MISICGAKVEKSLCLNYFVLNTQILRRNISNEGGIDKVVLVVESEYSTFIPVEKYSFY